MKVKIPLKQYVKEGGIIPRLGQRSLSLEFKDKNKGRVIKEAAPDGDMINVTFIDGGSDSYHINRLNVAVDLDLHQKYIK
jgi:hypothetical protein